MGIPTSVIEVKFQLYTGDEVADRVVENLNLFPGVISWNSYSSRQEAVIEWVIKCQIYQDRDLEALEQRLLEAIRGKP